MRCPETRGRSETILLYGWNYLSSFEYSESELFSYKSVKCFIKVFQAAKHELIDVVAAS